MGLTAVLLLSACLQTQPVDASRAQGQANVSSWSEAWDGLDTLGAKLAAGEGLDLALQRQLMRFGLQHPDKDRRHLFMARLSHVTGDKTPKRWDWLPGEDQAWPFDGRESWLLAELVGGGALRTRAVVAALDATPGELSRKELMLAWNAAVEDARALRLERGALPVQQRLHDRYRAPWSASDLALTQGWLGRYQAADALLQEAIEAESAAGNPTGDLWARRGLLALGNRDEPAAKDYLQRGRTRGSDDAVQIQAKLDLDRGRIAAARRGFCGLLPSKPPLPWARRGWGLTLLPSAPSDRSADPHLSH